jgi:hypothetical protein
MGPEWCADCWNAYQAKHPGECAEVAEDRAEADRLLAPAAFAPGQRFRVMGAGSYEVIARAERPDDPDRWLCCVEGRAETVVLGGGFLRSGQRLAGASRSGAPPAGEGLFLLAPSGLFVCGIRSARGSWGWGTLQISAGPRLDRARRFPAAMCGELQACGLRALTEPEAIEHAAGFGRWVIEGGAAHGRSPMHRGSIRGRMRSIRAYAGMCRGRLRS